MFNRRAKNFVILILVFTMNLIIIFVINNNRSYTPYHIEVILKDARSKIESELRDYHFNVSGVHGWADLVPEIGGDPLKVLVISSWRTGSTFLGDIHNSVPGNFYHYEPLWHLRIITGMMQINGPPFSESAIKIVKSAFKCDYKDGSFKDYFSYKNDHPRHFYHNSRFWAYCKKDVKLCLDPVFTGKFCSLFPFQSMKLVRFRLNLVKDLLEDSDNLKIVLLIRDPRAMSQSRRHDEFCRPYPVCSSPEYFCADMLSDYTAAVDLMRLYPGRLKIIRYEELAMEPFKTTQDLLSYLRLDYSLQVDRFLQTHTNTSNTNRRATVRKSKDIPFKWKHLLDFKDVEEIQLRCSGAMEKWGYLPADNATHLASEDFNPLGNYSIYEYSHHRHYYAF